MRPKTPYVSTLEAAQLLGLSKARVDQFVRHGRLKCVLIGNGRAILRADVEAFAKMPRVQGRPKKGAKS